MARNKLNDLTDHLFEMVEKLNDNEFCENETNVEDLIKRAKIMSDISHQIIEIQNTQLRAFEIADKCGYKISELPSSLSLEYKR